MQRLIQDLLAYSRVGTKGKDLLKTSSEGALKTALSNLRGAIEESRALVTHDPLLAGRCDRVVRMRSGRIDGEPHREPQRTAVS